MQISPKRKAELRDSFSRQTIMATFGAELVELDKGHVVIEAPISPGALQQHGFAHAGLTFTLGDSAAGYAAMTWIPEGQDVMTVEMKINLIAPAKGDMLRATGEVVRPGRRLLVVRSVVTAVENGRETDVALLQGTMIPA
ncbi:PaaI family thioesterase [Primorskyibacter aestuariivivens]|uniref:PaaI family thioesterase n=1 Tax=Primorskyibacter aestuariivivens TaxID=1888912 RepID=UPI002300623F|nr:PaaI family thioesterase [Primorskyibacter aestuariivivens]MDA7428430.1 PaaI family thioesterase [Primorskyibacter aestuariivivens]